MAKYHSKEYARKDGKDLHPHTNITSRQTPNFRKRPCFAACRDLASGAITAVYLPLADLLR